MSYHLPAGFNPFPAGYEQNVPMKRGYYPPPPQYGQNGWGFGNPPQIFQNPQVIEYLQELNASSDSENDSDQVETFALEDDYSEGDDYDDEEGDDYDDEEGDDYEEEGDDYEEEGDDYEEEGDDRDDYDDEDDYDEEDGDDYDEEGDDRDDYDDEDDYEDEDDYDEDDYEDEEDDYREDFTHDDDCGRAVTKLLNHVPGSASAGATAVPVTGWSAAYTASGNKVKIVAYMTCWCTGVGNVTYNLLRNGAIIDSGTFFFNQGAVHMSVPPLYAVIPNETGTNTYSISVQGTAGYNCNVDINDKCLMVVTEY
jgi:hypothetical protein